MLSRLRTGMRVAAHAQRRVSSAAHPRLVDARSETDSGEVVTLRWDDGAQASFHRLWLRDNCVSTRHESSRQKLTSAACLPDDLHVQQLRAERPLRCEAADVLPQTTTSLSDYAYSVEIYGKNGPPLVAKHGRLGPTGLLAIKLWDQADKPAWASKIVTDFRTLPHFVHAVPHAVRVWDDSDGRRIASELQVRIFITRPSDFASFCLYDGFVTRDGYENPMLEIVNNFNAPTTESDDEDGDDTFYLNFAEMALPLAGAAALDLKSRGRYTGAKVQPTLHLRSQGYHSDEDDPLYDPAKPNGNLARDGELHFRFFAGDFVTSPADLPGQTATYFPTPPSYDAQGQPLERPSRVPLRDHDDIVRYFESFAPF